MEMDNDTPSYDLNKWNASFQLTKSNFARNRSEWNDLAHTMFDFCLDIPGDKLENLMHIISILNMFPTFVTKEICTGNIGKLGTTEKERANFYSLLSRGKLYNLSTLLFYFSNRKTVSIVPNKETLVLETIRILKNVPDTIVSFLLSPCNVIDISEYCNMLYENLFLKSRYSKNCNLSQAYLSKSINFTISDKNSECETMFKILLNRQHINAYHLKNYVNEIGDIVQDCFDSAHYRRYDMYVSYKIDNIKKRSFKGFLIFVHSQSDRDVLNPINERNFFQTISKVTGLSRINADIFNYVPKTVKLMKEKYINYKIQDVGKKIMLQNLPPFITTKSLTKEQRQTFSFMRETELHLNYRDSFGYAFEYLDNKEKVIMCSPYLYNATIPLLNSDWIKSKEYAGGIVANQTGSGKTLSIYAVCQTGTSLIIVPDHLVTHWETEMKKHTNLNLVPSDTEPYAIIIGKSKDFPTKTQVTRLPTIVVITFSAFRSKKRLTLHVPETFDRIVIDEAHTLEKSRSIFEEIIQVKTKFTWAVSATPYKNFHNILTLIRFKEFLRTIGKNIWNMANTHLSHKAIPIWQMFAVSTCTKLPFVKVKNKVVYAQLTTEEELFFDKLKETFRNFHSRVSTQETSGMRRVFRILERVSAGGKINAKLMLRIIERHMSKKRNRTDSTILEAVIIANKTSFCKSNDECSVCLERFSEPCQLSCGHVFCKVCLLSMIDLGTTKCAMCRTPWKFPLPTFKPLWLNNVSSSSSSSSSSSKILEEENIDLKTYYKMLEGTDSSDNTSDCIELKGKLKTFKIELNDFIQSKQLNKRLVIYVKREKPALDYLKEIEKTNLSILSAGINGLTKSVSVDNIEKFRSGQADVLITSIKFSTGLDLQIASHLWIMDYDINLSKIDQCKGRCDRLGQKHSEIQCVVFLYRNTFDDFLYQHQHLGNVSCSMSNCTLLEYFFYRNEVNTMAWKVRKLAEKVFPNETFVITSHNKTLVINNVIKIQFVSGLINGRYSLDRMLSRGTNFYLFERWRIESIQ